MKYELIIDNFRAVVDGFAEGVSQALRATLLSDFTPLCPFFASSSIMQVRTKAEKLMPRRAASSFAASRRVSGDAQGHGDLVAVHQEASDLGLAGLLLMSSL